LKAFEDKLNTPEYTAGLAALNTATDEAVQWSELYFAAKKISDGKLNAMLA